MTRTTYATDEGDSTAIAIGDARLRPRVQAPRLGGPFARRAPGMNLLDAIVTLAIGVLLLGRPQAFFQPRGSQDEQAKRGQFVRKLGFLLTAAGILLALAAIGRR